LIRFENFYRCFINKYSSIITPLTKLTKKTEKFWWTSKQEQIFKELKSKFTSLPIMKDFDLRKPTIIETDISNFASSTIISQ
jgi:hypothetical protein